MACIITGMASTLWHVWHQLYGFSVRFCLLCCGAGGLRTPNVAMQGRSTARAHVWLQQARVWLQLVHVWLQRPHVWLQLAHVWLQLAYVWLQKHMHTILQ